MSHTKALKKQLDWLPFDREEILFWHGESNHKICPCDFYKSVFSPKFVRGKL